MHYAVNRGRMALAAGLLLAGLTLGAWAAPGATGSNAAARSEDQETLAGFRQSVWLLYSSSAAIGPDARGRTIAQDLATWVLPDEIRRQLAEATSNSNHVQTDQGRDAAVLEEPQRRLKLIGLYWARQLTLRHQRALWLQALQSAPAGEAESSHARVDALESRLQHDFAPSMTLDALSAQIKELTLTYDRERQRLIGLGPEVRGAAFDRSADVPCTHIVAQEPRTSSSQGLQRLWSPEPMDFYPMTGRRDLLTGRVLLQAAADDTGCLQHIEVVRSSGAPELDAAALDLAARMQFAPAVRDDRPVETTARLPIVFKFDDPPSLDARPPAAEAAPASATPSVPFSLAAQTPTEHIRNGYDLLDNGEYDKAIAEFDLAIATDPAAAMAYADRGLAHLWKYDIPQAHDDLEAALRIAPNSAVALRGRGVLEYLSGDCVSARADLTRSLELDAHSGFALRWRAEVDSCLSQDSEALTDLATAEKVEPKGFAAYSQRALVLRALGRPDEALAEIDAMLAVSSDSRAQLIAGAIYEEAGKPAEAATALDLGVSLSPTDKSYIRRAEYRPRADLRAQREDYAAALKVDPTSRYALSGLITVSALEGGDSPEVLSAALASHPEDAMGLLGRGIDRWRRGERSAAEQDLRASIQHASNSELNGMCYALAVVNVALDRALEACNRALGLMPHVADFLDSRGLVYLRLGRLEEALADYDLGLKLRPHSADSLYARGLVLARLGRLGPAAEDRAVALRLDATIAEYFHTIGLDR
jgi:TonB family protein